MNMHDSPERSPMLRQPGLPPDGSTIRKTGEFDETTYTWKHPGGGILRYFLARFISLWLCGWAFGVVMVTSVLISKKADAPQLFLLALLGLWVIGGIGAMHFLWRLLRRSIPESTSITTSELRYDSGTPPFTFRFNLMRHADIHDMFNGLTRRRKKLNVPKSEVKSFELERVGERQRLYFDHGADRVEIGRCLKEPEREWLAETLQAWLMN